MAQFIIPLRDDTLKTEVGSAFAAAYANPDELTNEQLVVLHVSNFIRQVLNDYRVKEAVTDAEAGVTKENSLS